MDFTGNGEPTRIHAAYVDAGLLQTLGVQPMLGRWISDDEDVKGGPRNVVVSYPFWRDFLGSDPHVLGKAIRLSGNSYTVIGVMPIDFSLPKEQADVFVSLWVAYPGGASDRDVHFMHTYWRLKPGVTLTQAQAEIAQVDRRLAEQFPDVEKERGTILIPLHDWLVGNIRPALLVLFGAVGLVLLIACANFAMLLMARAVARERELMIRASLGAKHGRLIRQRLTESTLLALVGGAIGLLVAKLGTMFLLALKPAALHRFHAIPIDARVFAFVFVISLLTGLLFGLLPAWSASRSDIAEALRANQRATGVSRSLLRSVLITAEVALALILLAGSGLLIKGFLRLRSVNPGFNPANVMTMYLQLPATRYSQFQLQTNFRRELLARINALPGVDAAMITDIPLAGNYVGHRVVIDGRPTLAVGAEPKVQTLSVMGEYFGVMQIPIRAGRDFLSTDREGQPLVAVVNEAFVREHMPGQNPIGSRIDWINEPHKWMTIVGVAADVKYSGLNQPVDPAVYAPFSQNDEAWRTWITLVIKSRAPVAELVEDVKKQVWSLDSQIPVSDIQSMDDLMAVSMAQERFNMLLLGILCRACRGAGRGRHLRHDGVSRQSAHARNRCVRRLGSTASRCPAPGHEGWSEARPAGYRDRAGRRPRGHESDGQPALRGEADGPGNLDWSSVVAGRRGSTGVLHPGAAGLEHSSYDSIALRIAGVAKVTSILPQGARWTLRKISDFSVALQSKNELRGIWPDSYREVDHV